MTDISVQDIDDLIAESADTSASIGQEFYDIAMDSVRDLLDNSVALAYSNRCVYAPQAIAREGQAMEVRQLIPGFLYDDDEEDARLELAGIAHDRSHCFAGTCAAHNPSRHHMRFWPAAHTAGVLVRRCSCGLWHPDPDQFDQWFMQGLMQQAEHQCDGCCLP